MQLELLALDRPSQIMLDGKALRSRGAHRVVVEKEAVAALRFGVIHRNVGVLQKRVEVVPVSRIQDDSDRRRYEYLLLSDNDRLGKCFKQPVGSARRVRLRCHAVQQDDELVAALTAYVALQRFAGREHRDVFQAEPAGEPLRDDAQKVVADRMAEGVVDALEVIQIEKHDRERGGIAFRGIERLGQLFVETRAIRQFGQDIEIRQAMDLLDRPRAFSRVLERAGDTLDPTRCTDQRLAEDVHVAQLSGGGHNANVETLLRGPGRQLDEPAPKGAAIVRVYERLNRPRRRVKAARIDAENVMHFVGACDAIGGALPFPAADMSDALRAGELLRDALARGDFALAVLVCRLEPPERFDGLAMRVLEIADELLEGSPPTPSASRFGDRVCTEMEQHRMQIRQHMRQPGGDHSDPYATKGERSQRKLRGRQQSGVEKRQQDDVGECDHCHGLSDEAPDKNGARSGPIRAFSALGAGHRFRSFAHYRLPASDGKRRSRGEQRRPQCAARSECFATSVPER